MSMPARLHQTPPGIALGPLDALPVGAARGVELEIGTGRFHGFVLRTAGGIHGYVDRCPHMGLPLAQKPDAYLSPGGAYIACRQHGALFDPATGLCIGGPCRGASLIAWPLHVEAGEIVTGPAIPATNDTDDTGDTDTP
jgi:nitrite reductase/ring-hydroxylating ferredoxin subunit